MSTFSCWNLPQRFPSDSNCCLKVQAIYLRILVSRHILRVHIHWLPWFVLLYHFPLVPLPTSCGIWCCCLGWTDLSSKRSPIPPEGAPWILSYSFKCNSRKFLTIFLTRLLPILFPAAEELLPVLFWPNPWLRGLLRALPLLFLLLILIPLL